MDSKRIEAIKQSLLAGKFEPFVRHIRFPHYKNLLPGLRLDFKFPITVLVGPNGSNKSSVLRAIACCPHYQNLGDHWFSTSVDPIEESGGRPRYIFGYQDPYSQKIVEVLQTRVKSKDDPDYWEPARPSLQDGMEKMPPFDEAIPPLGRTKTRWAGIQKKVLIIDFRTEISAFDKLFYHGGAAENYRGKKLKYHLRSRAKHLKKVIENGLVSYKPYRSRKEMVRKNFELPSEQVETISWILGRNYASVRLVHHSLFENLSYTAIISSDGLSYSEAFAGSGEFAVIMLVHRIMTAENCSLIVLDEPEVSLHPGAQSRLMEFVVKVCLEKKHQFFIGTHSKFIVDPLPSQSIILLSQDPVCKKVVAQHDVNPWEAFFHLGMLPPHKKKIFVEDALAAELVRFVLREMGVSALSYFEVVPYPGGAETIFGKLMPRLLQAGDTDSIFILDGDKRPAHPALRSDQIPGSEEDKVGLEITRITGINNIYFDLDGGNDPYIKEKKAKLERRFLNLLSTQVRYLPSDTPEMFIVASLPDCGCALSELSPKQFFVELTRKEKGLLPTEEVRSVDILETQVRKLAKIGIKYEDFSEIIDLLRERMS